MRFQKKIPEKKKEKKEQWVHLSRGLGTVYCLGVINKLLLATSARARCVVGILQKLETCLDYLKLFHIIAPHLILSSNSTNFAYP